MLGSLHIVAHGRIVLRYLVYTVLLYVLQDIDSLQGAGWGDFLSQIYFGYPSTYGFTRGWVIRWCDGSQT